MIQELLVDIEMDVKYKIFTEQKNLVAIKNLKELLNQIDHEVEVVPYKDKEKLSRLLVSLKGQTLNDYEHRMIERIIKNRNEKGEVLIENKMAKIVGNVCMDMLMIDVTNIKCEEGDEVVFFDDKSYSAEEFSKKANTISYELISSISRRIKRVVSR